MQHQEPSVAKTVLITGCSSGFGLASARLFGERGWNVIIATTIISVPPIARAACHSEGADQRL
ncbi:hypothetical protein [Sphingomonas sp. TDK1]|uniref:hypothetical protein n=1 Tax=Sphingomonas sp. TDK1 TaxID=453247 RepID=UPI0022B6BF36|nr:hypothetical protein [Sphingomonas sp. TDK1]